MADTSVLVVSCDKYSDLWRPFFILYRRFWKENFLPTYLGSNYLEFKDEGITMLPIGEDKSWSHGVLRMLEHIETPYIILMLEDFFLRYPVNTEEILTCIDIIKELNGKMLRLVPRPGPDKDVPGYSLIGEVKTTSAFRVSTQSTLWHKATLQSLLKENESVWEFEINGSDRSRHDPYGYYCVRSPVLTYKHHVIERGKWFRKEARYFGTMNIGCDFNARMIMTRRETYLWYMNKFISIFRNMIPWALRQNIKQSFKTVLRQ